MLVPKVIVTYYQLASFIGYKNFNNHPSQISAWYSFSSHFPRSLNLYFTTYYSEVSRIKFTY